MAKTASPMLVPRAFRFAAPFRVTDWRAALPGSFLARRQKTILAFLSEANVMLSCALSCAALCWQGTARSLRAAPMSPAPWQ
eukprot:9893338-Alexandrium_andersonii.AAC.1